MNRLDIKLNLGLKKAILSLLLLLLHLSCFSQKESALEIHVISLYSKEKLPEMQVKLFEDSTLLFTTFTDSLGKVTFTSLTNKSYKVCINDTAEKGFKESCKNVYFEKREKINLEVFLAFTAEKEKAFFKEIDEKYSHKIETHIKYDSTYNSQVDGFEAFKRELATMINYPQESLENGSQGKVYLSFVVNEDGCVSHVRVERGVDSEIDREAIRILRYSTVWKPAIQNGIPIKTKLRIPIYFTLR
jgi:TonB family protein